MSDLLIGSAQSRTKNSVEWSWLLCPFMCLPKPRSLNNIPSRRFDQRLGAWIDRKIKPLKSYLAQF